VRVPEALVAVFDWIPTALLVLVGTMNLRLLRRRDVAFAPAGWKLKLVPQRLHASPWGSGVNGRIVRHGVPHRDPGGGLGIRGQHCGGGLSAALAPGWSAPPA